MIDYYFFFVFLQRIINLRQDSYEKNATIHYLWDDAAALIGA